MAPAKPAKGIKIIVPRHNSQRIGRKLSSELKKQGKARGVLLQTGQPSSRLAQAIESASEWNSLLMTARAERGPQWDVGTQQFLVDKDSDLYYDPSPLFEAIKKDEEGPEDLPQPQMQQQPMAQQGHHTFQIQQTPSNTSTRSHHTPRRDMPADIGMAPPHLREQSPHRPPGFPGSPAGMNPMNMNMNMPMNMGMGMRGPPGGAGPYPGGGPPFNPSGNQFMPGGDLASGGSPMRIAGGMGNMMGGGGMRPNMAGMGGMGGMPGNMGGAGMGGIPMGGMPGGGMGGPGLGGGMAGMGGGGMMNMGGMVGNMAGGVGGMPGGMGGGMSNLGGMGMGNMGVDMGLGMNMSPRGMRGVPDDGGFPPIH